MTKKDVPYEWSEKCDRIFNELKNRSTIAPVLAFLSRRGGYVVLCDALELGL